MRTKKILLAYILFSVLAGIGLAVWRTLLMLRYYDPYNNEYALEADVALKSIGFTLFFVFIILATVAIVLTKFEFKPFSASDHQSSIFTSALLGFVFLAIGVFVSLYMKTALETESYPLYKYTQFVSYVLLFLCAVYFILNAAGHPRFDNVKKKLAFIPPVWGIAFLVSSYVDPAFNYKDFNHTLCNVAICALVFFFLYDSKMVIMGKATIPYFIFALISLTASIVYMIPTFILLAYWELSSDINHIFEAVLLGSIFYTCTCLRNLCKNVQPAEKKKEEPKTEA